MTPLRGWAAAICLLAVLSTMAVAQGRLRPPANLPCDRNQTTSYTGAASSYSRSKSALKLVVLTEEGTRESVRLTIRKGENLEKFFLWEGEPFRAEDWTKLESAEGKLRDGIRVTAWVCSSGATPVLDWRAPPR